MLKDEEEEKPKKKESRKKEKAPSKGELKWGWLVVLMSREQKKKEQLKSEVEAISGSDSAFLLYGKESWNHFHLHPTLYENLMGMHCDRPTVIQEKVIEAAFSGYDVLGAAPTGSGKTLAFCVPMVDWLLKHGDEEDESDESDENDGSESYENGESESGENDDGDEEENSDDVVIESEGDDDEGSEGDDDIEDNHDDGDDDHDNNDHNDSDDDNNNDDSNDNDTTNTTNNADSAPWHLRCLVITPTRELALQITRVLARLTAHTPLTFPSLAPLTRSTVGLIGGLALPRQQRLLKRRPQIIVATPGRLWYFLQRAPLRNAVRRLRFLVADEADKLVGERGCDHVQVAPGAYPELPQAIQALAASQEKRQLWMVRVTCSGFERVVSGDSSQGSSSDAKGSKDGKGLVRMVRRDHQRDCQRDQRI